MKSFGILVALAALCSMLGCQANDHTPAGRGSCQGCNLVLISLDTLRADRLGVYGHTRNTSPMIDAIAADGVVFNQAFAQSTWTLPSHFSILTGLYPSRHRVVHGQAVLSADVPTLPEILRNHGYRTAAFTGAGYVKESWGYRGFDLYDEVSGVVHPWEKTWASVRRAAEWARGAQQPFFLFFHTYGPHAPHTPRPEDDIFVAEDYRGPINTIPDIQTEPCLPELDRLCTQKHAEYFTRLDDRGLLSQRDVDRILAAYDGEVRSTDAIVAHLWHALDAAGLLGNTVIGITSDHGESFEPSTVVSPRRYGHTNPYFEVVRVPMIIRSPSTRLPDVSGRPVETIDLLPTLMDLVEIDVPAEIDGRSLLEYGSDVLAGAAIYEHWGSKAGGRLAVGIVRGPWHLIKWSKRPAELYDLDSGTGPYRSVDDRHPEIVTSLSAALDRWQQVLDDRGRGSDSSKQELDIETRAQLEALGYL